MNTRKRSKLYADLAGALIIVAIMSAFTALAVVTI